MVAAIVLLPFDSFPYFRDMLREMGAMASFYPLFVALLLFAVSLRTDRRNMFPQSTGARVLVLFLLWIFISTVANWSGIASAFFKGRTGFEKAALQLALFAFVAVVPFYVFRATEGNKDLQERLRLPVLLSFLLPAMFSILEVLFLYGVISHELPLALRRFFSDNLWVYNRLRTVAAEPSSFSIYCAFLFPWLMGWLMVARGADLAGAIAVLGYFIFILVLTFSRSAYLMILAEALFFIVLTLWLDRRRGRALTLGALFLTFFGTFNLLAPRVMIYDRAIVEKPVSTLISGAVDVKDPETGSSTRIRLGAQLAGFRIAARFPLFGAGFGQAGFHMKDYAPEWADPWLDEVKNWKDATPGTPWAPMHGLYARVAAESGFIGLLLWLGVWGTTAAGVLARARRAEHNSQSGILLLTAMMGTLLTGLLVDSFRFFEGWIVLGLAWAYISTPREGVNASGRT